MADHLVVGAYGEALGLPCAFERFLDLRLGPATGRAQGFGQSTHLRGGSYVTDQHAAGGNHAVCLLESVPRVEHVEHDTVEPAFGQFDGHGVEVAGFEIPPAGGFTVIQRGVGLSHFGEFGAQLDRGQMAALAHGVQQIHAHRARAGTGLKHAHAGADVAELNDLGDVLRIHDLRAARHRKHIIGQSRAHHRILPAADGARRFPRLVLVFLGVDLIDLCLALGVHGEDDGAFGLADHIVMQNQAMLGLRGAAGHKLIGDLLALAVGELHLLACGERPAPRLHNLLLVCSVGQSLQV